MKKLLYYIVYSLLYLMSLLPFRMLYWLSNLLFFLIFHVFHYRRRTVWVNLVTSFPEREPEEHKVIERHFYRWFCDYLVETIKLMSISNDEIKRRMVFKNTELLEQCVLDGQSCAVYLGHYGNWEWVTSLPLWISDLAQCGQIYHPLENKDVNNLLLKIRQRFGAICIAMNDTLRYIVEYKQKNRPIIIGYISDQTPFWFNIHHWCQFLHHDTAVLSGTERIARRNNHAVFFLEVNRIRRGYYEATMKLITCDPKSLNEFELTDTYFQMLETCIVKNPPYWLWTHDRWKRTRERFNLRFELKDGKVHEKEEGKLYN